VEGPGLSMDWQIAVLLRNGAANARASDFIPRYFGHIYVKRAHWIVCNLNYS
jgi:hypothetical protein